MSMAVTKLKTRRRSSGGRSGRRGPRRLKPQPPASLPELKDYPYTMRLKDGRTIYVEIPGRWTTHVRGYGVGFLPPAVRLLDKLQSLAMSVLDRPPTPGYLATLRVALGLTQAEFGERVGVDRMTVSRWERGTLRPSDESLAAMERERAAAVRKGVVMPG
jgi:DNA-binding XRE family transcriptional regulator